MPVITVGNLLHIVRQNRLHHLITGLQLGALGKEKGTSVMGKGGGITQGVGRKKK
jgi:hypothetical protein